MMKEESLEFDELVQRYLDGTVTEGEMAALNGCLSTDRVARDRFSEWLDLDSALGNAAAGWPVAEPAVVPFPEAKKSGASRPRHFAVMAGAAAALVAVFLGLAMWWKPVSSATVTSVAGAADWAAGMEVGRQRIEFERGSIELLTAEGVRLAIEAPAEFHFESSMRMIVSRGRIAADVPPAGRGFTLVTPTGKAVDLGTRFGVDVVEGGDAEIHVFEGEVIATDRSGGAEQSLRGGDAVSLKQEGSAARELRSSAFIQPDEVAGLRSGLEAGQPQRSAEAIEALREDPALIALLDFEESVSDEGEYRLVQGRWPGSTAPEFADGPDHLQVDLGGERTWPQLTMAAWVRLDHLGRPYQSLFHTDDWNAAKQGQVHWMVTSRMTMRLALRGNVLTGPDEDSGGFPDSRTSVLPERGKWLHLAAVYDAPARSVHFYVNGKLDQQSALETAHPARLGPAQIGNWNQGDRRLSGRVDELILLGRTMAEEEIRSLFEAGNPYEIDTP